MVFNLLSKARIGFPRLTARRPTRLVSHRGREIRILSNPFAAKRPTQRERVLTIGAILGAILTAATTVVATLTGNNA